MPFVEHRGQMPNTSASYPGVPDFHGPTTNYPNAFLFPQFLTECCNMETKMGHNHFMLSAVPNHLKILRRINLETGSALKSALTLIR